MFSFWPYNNRLRAAVIVFRVISESSFSERACLTLYIAEYYLVNRHATSNPGVHDSILACRGWNFPGYYVLLHILRLLTREAPIERRAECRYVSSLQG